MIWTLFWVIAHRLASVLPVFLIVTVLVFVALRLLPVDAAQMSMPPTATIAEVEARRIEMGLNLPIPQQYAIWFARAAHGDFGQSAQYRTDTMALVLSSLPATIELTLLALLFAMIVGVGGGLLIFASRGSVLESAGLVCTSVVMALPDFLLGLLFILFLGVMFPIFPINGRLDAGMVLPRDGTGFLLVDTLLTGDFALFGSAVLHMVLPVAALGLAFSPTIVRVLHSSLLATYQESYIKQARLRGLDERTILFRHALKNAILPVLILVGTQFGGLFGGTLLIEMIFSYPGLGNLMLRSMRSADLNVIQTVSLFYCGTTLLFNSMADAGVYMLNPRLRTR